MPLSTTLPRIAVGPEPAWRWVLEAVQAGGGLPVPLTGAAGADAEGVLGDADALVWLRPDQPAGLPEALAVAPHVRWVQLPWAGVEHVAALELFNDGRVWTAGKGAFADVIAEHALALTLAGLRRLPESARARSWGAEGGRSLLGGRVTVVGGGAIATGLLALMAPFGAEVTVVRRRPSPLPGASRTVGPEHLRQALTGVDAVVLALALTPDTVGLIGAAELAAMGSQALLVNVSRGAHVDTEALVAALVSGTIAGAALDVTEPEPLGDGHPLWDVPSCLITPHRAGTFAMVKPGIARRISENVRRFAAGEPLVGVIDPSVGY